MLSVDVEPLYAALASSLSSSSSTSSSYPGAAAVPAGTVFPPPPHPSHAVSAAAAAATGPFLSTAAAFSASRSPLRIVHRSVGFIQSRLVLRGCYVSSALEVCAIGSEDCSVSVVHLPTGRCMRRLVGHSGPVNCVSWSRQRQCAVSASDDHTLRVWRLRHTQQKAPRSAVGSSNGHHVAGAEDDSDEDEHVESQIDAAPQQHYSSGPSEDGADRKRRRRRNAAQSESEAEETHQQQQVEKAAGEAGASAARASV